MAPALLSLLKVDGLQSFFNGLMTCETGPLMVTSLGTQLGLRQISDCLVKPVLGTVYALILRLFGPAGLILGSRSGPQPNGSWGMPTVSTYGC